MILRPSTYDDAEAWATTVLEASPHLVVDTASELHEMRHDPPGTERRVAEVGGEVVGIARARIPDEEEHGSLVVMVRPSHRRRGIGTALVEAAWPFLAASGKDRVIAIVEDDDGSRIASAHWGFLVTRQLRKSYVDPRTVAEPGPPADGVTVVPLTEVGSEAVWRAQSQVARDDPSGLTVPVPWTDWQDEWSDPRGRPDLGRAVLVDGELAAYTLVGTAGERAWSDMTGTLPPHRGRGYARLAKQHALRAAAAAGITAAFTGNDGQNLPMIAVNDRLGYTPVAAPSLAERRL